MKNINYLTIILLSFLVVSCSKITDPVKKIGLGNRVVNYQADEKVDSLIIPPDLTAPSSQGAFTQVTEVSDDENVVKRVQNVEVMRDKYRRWLVVDMPPSEVWMLTKEFFRSYNFKINRENQKIGILETDYLEIETVVPDKSLGAIRASLAKVLKTQYGLPIADKYRVRIEPIEGQNKSEVYLTLSSIGEVVSGATRVWQPREKDVELETEMLLTLMVFLGSDRAEAIEKIQSNTASNESNALVETAENGYANFLKVVSEGRNMSEQEVDIIAQGRVWTGIDGLENGLVDELGNLQTAIQAAATLAELDTFDVVSIAPKVSSKQAFVNQLFSKSISLLPSGMIKTPLLLSVLNDVEKQANFMTRLNDPQSRFVYCTQCQIK